MPKAKTLPRNITEHLPAAIAQALEKLTYNSLAISAQP
jgi:hypothetical protein